MIVLPYVVRFIVYDYRRMYFYVATDQMKREQFNNKNSSRLVSIDQPSYTMKNPILELKVLAETSIDEEKES